MFSSFNNQWPPNGDFIKSRMRRWQSRKFLIRALKRRMLQDVEDISPFGFYDDGLRGQLLATRERNYQFCGSPSSDAASAATMSRRHNRAISSRDSQAHLPPATSHFSIIGDGNSAVLHQNDASGGTKPPAGAPQSEQQRFVSSVRWKCAPSKRFVVKDVFPLTSERENSYSGPDNSRNYKTCSSFPERSPADGSESPNATHPGYPIPVPVHHVTIDCQTESEKRGIATPQINLRNKPNHSTRRCVVRVLLPRNVATTCASSQEGASRSRVTRALSSNNTINVNTISSNQSVLVAGRDGLINRKTCQIRVMKMDSPPSDLKRSRARNCILKHIGRASGSIPAKGERLPNSQADSVRVGSDFQASDTREVGENHVTSTNDDYIKTVEFTASDSALSKNNTNKFCFQHNINAKNLGHRQLAQKSEKNETEMTQDISSHSHSSVLFGDRTSEMEVESLTLQPDYLQSKDAGSFPTHYRIPSLDDLDIEDVITDFHGNTDARLEFETFDDEMGQENKVTSGIVDSYPEMDLPSKLESAQKSCLTCDSADNAVSNKNQSGRHFRNFVANIHTVPALTVDISSRIRADKCERKVVGISKGDDVGMKSEELHHSSTNNEISDSSSKIPEFYFPNGKPRSPDELRTSLKKISSAFDSLSKENLTSSEMAPIAVACGYPTYWKSAMFKAAAKNGASSVSKSDVIAMWKRVCSSCHDDSSRFVQMLSKPGKSHLEFHDLLVLLQDVVASHPGLVFLREAPEFHTRYMNTVIARIFYSVNRSWSGQITIPELRRSNFLQVLASLDEVDDINCVTDYFSYEHFYVIYCKFWELDTDHDLVINKFDLSRHANGALSSRVIDRVLSGAVTRWDSSDHRAQKMSYVDFVWFIISEEDKKTATSIEYWFRCMDLDGDGVISIYEMEYFYEEQINKLEQLDIEPLPFEDCVCQMLDMVKPRCSDYVTLKDLKNCKMAQVFFDTFFNVEKYLDHEQKDPFAPQKDVDCMDTEPSDWDKYAAEEYELLVAEEQANEQEAIDLSYDDDADPIIEEEFRRLGLDGGEAGDGVSTPLPEDFVDTVPGDELMQKYKRSSIVKT